MEEYRPVGNRCAVVLSNWQLPCSEEEALEVLDDLGFKVESVDLVELARSCIGRAKYQLQATTSLAPCIVDCSSFTKWLYGRRGIWLPRLSVDQRKVGVSVKLEVLRVGDLVFTSGRRGGLYDTDPSDGVGHVGMATSQRTIIHAAGSKRGVVEDSLSKFLSKGEFRGARRYLGNPEPLTLLAPSLIEESSFVKWKIVTTFGSRVRRGF